MILAPHEHNRADFEPLIATQGAYPHGEIDYCRAVRIPMRIRIIAFHFSLLRPLTGDGVFAGFGQSGYTGL
jgi:hypothetical protein